MYRGVRLKNAEFMIVYQIMWQVFLLLSCYNLHHVRMESWDSFTISQALLEKQQQRTIQKKNICQT